MYTWSSRVGRHITPRLKYTNKFRTYVHQIARGRELMEARKDKELPGQVELVTAAAESKYSRPSSREKGLLLDCPSEPCRKQFGALSEVPMQLSALRDALETGESDVFCVKAAAFVDMWQGGREQMESHPAFVDSLLVAALACGMVKVPQARSGPRGQPPPPNPARLLRATL